MRRGQIVLADVGLDEPKRFVVVSNNSRNRALRSALVVRSTTSDKPDLPSIVKTGQGDPEVTTILCDDVMEIVDEEVLRVIGALSPATMARVEQGLRHALGL
jgi:mRNA interferase MazF